MSARLAELRRQRALLQDHLAWLDREIAAAENTAPAARAPAANLAPPTPRSASASVAVTPPPSGVSLHPTSSLAASPEAILEEYRVEPSAVKSDVRKGCLLYFAAAFALLILVVAILYFALSSR